MTVQLPSPIPSTPAAGTAATQSHVVNRWLSNKRSSQGKHALHLLSEVPGARVKVLKDLRTVIRGHYVSPAITAQLIADHGAPLTAKLLREMLPKTPTARSGDIGEILATEITEQILGFNVPIRRLRWKDGRNMALRGDDIVGVRVDSNRKLTILKGEAKSYANLTSTVVDNASDALDRNRGRPGRHSVLFVATRLRESGSSSDASLATQLEATVLAGFTGCDVEHLLFALTSTDPNGLLTNHLTALTRKMTQRHAVGLRITDHAAFIKSAFRGL